MSSKALKYILLFTAVCVAWSLPAEEPKPKILIYMCSYGSGHRMATQAIVERLGDYDLQVVDVYDGPLLPLDPLRQVAPEVSQESCFNFMAKQEWNSALNLTRVLSNQVLLLKRRKIEGWLWDHLEECSPDLVISTIPLIDSMLLNVCEGKNIPLLVVTTDIDINDFCLGFSDDDKLPNPSKFRMTVPFSKGTWYPAFGRNLPKSIRRSLDYGFAYPTRLAFSQEFGEEELDSFRQQYGIQPDEHVAMVMMGGNTAKAAKTYAKLLVEMSDAELDTILGAENPRCKLRLLCLCGDLSQPANQALKAKLEATNSLANPRVTIHAAAGTPHIAKLVSLPEMFAVISKPGGSTTNEMIKKRMPMVYHWSGSGLVWERGNLLYGEGRGYGIAYQPPRGMRGMSREDLVDVLSELRETRQEILDGTMQVPEADFDFTTNLRTAVQEMLETRAKEREAA